MFIPIFKKIANLKLNQNFKSRKKSTKFIKLNTCNYGIISKSFSLLTLNQLEALRRYISRRINKKSKKYVRVSLTHRLFKKSSKSRMGKGCGKFYRWYSYLKPGQIIFEFNSILPFVKVFANFKTIAKKMPFKSCLKFNNIFFKI